MERAGRVTWTAGHEGNGERVGDERINLLRQSAPLLDECRQLIAILVTISKRARENK
jgi:hypothetical protein